MPQTQALELATEEKLTEWAERFAPYRHNPTKESLKDWLRLFRAEHLHIAHKLLDAVHMVSEIEIHQGYRDALGALPGWSKDKDVRQGRWYFVGAGSAGESGPAMLRLFREANGLTAEVWQSFCVTTRELPRLHLSAFDSVVFIDDFAGTGQQMVDYWPIMQELVASEAKCYLVLTATTGVAKQEIETKTELLLRSNIVLPTSANVFSQESKVFTQEERVVLESYGKKAWKEKPRGWGECGLTLVLSHKTPNNSLPILHANHNRWKGPFPRNLLGPQT